MTTRKPLTGLVVKSARPLFALALAFTITACGFQLRDAAELPPEMAQTRLEIQGPYTTLARRLRVLLQQSGVELVESGTAAAVLEVPVNQVVTDVLTIGDNARVREYRITHQVQFRLIDASGKELVPMQSLRQSREISFDEQEILGASREQEYLQQDLANSLARLILRRLEGASE
jgi:LPS-assembly lipoprotein